MAPSIAPMVKIEPKTEYCMRCAHEQIGISCHEMLKRGFSYGTKMNNRLQQVTSAKER